MRRSVTMIAVGLMLALGCGGGDGVDGAADVETATVDGASTAAAAGESTDGEVVAPQSAGQATVSVDGREFTFDTDGPADCRIESGSFTFSWVQGDNQVTLSGGGDVYDDDWLASIRLSLTDSDGLPISYEPDQEHLNEGIAIDGDNFSYSGPMLFQPPNDGSAPPPEPVGDGTISATCG